MAHCPSPDCRHRQRTGKPAEYHEEVEHCADCGTALVAGPPPRPPRAPRPAWPPSLLRRLALTVAAMVLVAALSWLPNPLLDSVAAAFGDAASRNTGPFCLGVRPLLVGFVLVEVVALILPFTRERRREDPSLRRWLWPIAVMVGLALAFVQGLSLAMALENTGAYGLTSSYGLAGGFGPPVVASPGWLFRLATAAMTTAGVAVLAGIVRGLDRHGLGPGMAALLIVDGLLLVGEGLVAHSRSVVMGEINLLTTLLVLAVLSAVMFGAWRVLGRHAGSLSSALPVCGLLPWELALTVVLIPSTIAALGLHGSERISDLLHPGGAVWVLIAAPLTVAFVPLAATLYHWRRRHWWHGPQRSSWLLAMAASAGMLVLLVLLDAAFMRAVPYLIGGGLVTWLTLLALLGDAREELLARRTLGPALRELAWHQDLPDALEQVAVLQHEDPDGVYVLTGRRFRSLTWFFGPYVPLRILGTPSTHSQS